eukprot:COSAG01_NODE_11180_length_1989_cov_1.563492_5_plen_102_part_00
MEQDRAKGLRWLRQAAIRGDMHAMYNAAYLLLHPDDGAEVPRAQREEAIGFWEGAAEQGGASSPLALCLCLCLCLCLSDFFGRAAANRCVTRSLRSRWPAT